MHKKTFVGLGISVPGIALLLWIFFLPLPGPHIDQRAHPLAIKLIDAFPELKNFREDEHRASLSWDVHDVDSRVVATFRVGRISSKARQDMILHYLESHIATEPLSQVDLIFYWKDEALAGHSREEQIEKRAPNPMTQTAHTKRL